MQCIEPKHIRNKKEGSTRDDLLLVPCGKCLPCRNARVNQWAFRLEQEAKGKYAYMFTLTYEKSPRTKNGKQTLKKRDLQLFFKKVRAATNRAARLVGARGGVNNNVKEALEKLGNPHKYKYYAVGEYGTRYRRPHYHVIMISGMHNMLDIVEKQWQHGIVHHAPLNIKTIRYTLKYLSKDAGRAKGEGENEFQIMSKGIGKGFLKGSIINYYKNTLNNYVVLDDGRKASLPRYYKDKIFTEDEKLLLNVKTKAYIDEQQKKNQNVNHELCKQEIRRIHEKNK
jgi:hypothetical protein